MRMFYSTDSISTHVGSTGSPHKGMHDITYINYNFINVVCYAL